MSLCIALKKIVLGYFHGNTSKQKSLIIIIQQMIGVLCELDMYKVGYAISK